jgi:hypothetical protein
MIFYRILSVCVFANILCHLFDVTSSPTSLATDNNTSLRPKASTENKKRKGFDIDLNFPPHVEEEGMSRAQKRRKDMSKLYNAAQTAKRRERKRTDPEYAKRRREVEKQSKQKSREVVRKLEGEEARLQRKIYNRTYYLKRKMKFDGHATKKEQEFAQTLQKMKKGEDVPVEDQQRALEFHEKRKRIQKQSKARRRQKDAMAQAQAQTRSS